MSAKPRRRGHPVLLLVDFINLFDFDGADKLMPRALAAARKTAALKARFRKSGFQSIYVNDNFGGWSRSFQELVRECLDLPGPPGEIARLLEPMEGDISILKPRHSAFYGTPLDFLLNELRPEPLVITGLAADNCVFATAQDAYVRKFPVCIPRDCIAAEQARHETLVLQHMARTLKAKTTPGARLRLPEA